jgi:glycosyltransferase involved in cell wall biosynthesis
MGLNFYMNAPLKKKYRFNLLIAVAGLNIGGAEVVIKHLVRTIDRSRFNVMVCCIKTRGIIGDELFHQGINVVTLTNSTKQKVDYFTFIRLLKVIRINKIDIIHTHTADALADAGVCKILLPRLKLVHTFHFGNYPSLKWRQMWIEKVFSTVPNRLVAVGEVQRKEIMDVFKIPERRIERVWNGVSRSLLGGNGSFRVQRGLQHRIIIGTIATLIEQKGLRELLAVAKQFQNISNKVLFVIVGEGPLRFELEQMRLEYKLEETVIFTGWVMNAAEVALPVFDIFFQPSLWEAMSVVILEAMEAGKPIVATRVGENSHIIEDDVNGLLVEPKDINGMVIALRRLIDDEELRYRLGRAAAKKVSREFTLESMTRAYENIYFESLN